MIDTSSRDAVRIVPMMREYMVEHGVNMLPVKFYGTNTLARMAGDSSIGYRKTRAERDGTGIVFYCTKIDADNLLRDLSLQSEPNNDNARPFAVFMPDHLFEQAVEVMKKNPLNDAAQKSDESSRYQRIRFLGDKKNVYLVKDARTGKYYVQKEYTVYNRNVFDRLKEAAIDGLPEIYEIREEQGRLHTLEEYIDGETLLKKLKRDGVFSEEEIKTIAISICMALKRLHSMKPILLHRDIKPSNIMVDKNGKIYLIDFNASREYRGNVSEDTELIGTQYFASPEQITGYHETTPSSDIFSLGATLSYLMTGVYAKNRIADGKYHDVWAKCIEDSAKDRYQNVEEFIGALVLAP